MPWTWLFSQNYKQVQVAGRAPRWIRGSRVHPKHLVRAVSPNIIRFSQENLKWGNTSFVWGRTDISKKVTLLTCYLHIWVSGRIQEVIISTCNDFAMWCIHSTELKTKLCEYLSSNLCQNICFDMLYSDAGGIRVLRSKDLHLTLKWEQIG